MNVFYVYANQWFTFTLTVLCTFDESLWKLSHISSCQEIAMDTERFDISRLNSQPLNLTCFLLAW